MKENLIDYIIIAFIFLSIIFLCWLDYKFPTVESEEKQHECTTFIKYQEHYMITPMTWGYRDSFKCIECGKNYKN